MREDGVTVDGVYGTYTTTDDGEIDEIVYLDEAGEVSTSAIANSTNLGAQSHFFYNQGYVIHAADQYDASFVKLREMRLDYNLPSKCNERFAVQQHQHRHLRSQLGYSAQERTAH